MEGPEVCDEVEKLLVLWLGAGRFAVAPDIGSPAVEPELEEGTCAAEGPLLRAELPARGDRGVDPCADCH